MNTPVRSATKEGSSPESRPRINRSIAVLGILALAAVPIQLVTFSFGYAQYVKGQRSMMAAFPLARDFAADVYLPFVLAPALAALVWLALYCRRRYPDVYRRLIMGAAIGAVATMALDVVRLNGVVNGWLPMDLTDTWGQLITGSHSRAVFYPAGLVAHYALFGASFGVAFAFLLGSGRRHITTVSYALAWSLGVLWLGMVTLPPTAPAMGVFGDKLWPGLFIVTLVAHAFYGVALGVLGHRFLTPARGVVPEFVSRLTSDSPGPRTRTGEAIATQRT